jgi:hypothetical protein
MRKQTLILLSLITINSISAEFLFKLDTKSIQVFIEYDLNGFKENGIHQETGTLYNLLGFKQNGFDANGEKPIECKIDGSMDYWGQSFAYNYDSSGQVIRLSDNSLSRTYYNSYTPNVQTGFVPYQYWNNAQNQYNYNYGYAYWEGSRVGNSVNNWNTRAIGALLTRVTLVDRRIDYTKNAGNGSLRIVGYTYGNAANGYTGHYNYRSVTSICRQEFEL